MKERKIRNKLMTYYLNLAELGNTEAEAKALAIGKQLFQEEEASVKLTSKIKVIFPSGTFKEYPSAKDVMLRFHLELDTLVACIEFGEVDAGGRMFEQIENNP